MQRYPIVALLLCFTCLPGRTRSQPVYTSATIKNMALQSDREDTTHG